MKNVYSLLSENYPKALERLQQTFPKFAEFTKKIKIVPWQKEFEQYDKNVWVFEEKQLLELFYRSSMISKEEYFKHSERLRILARNAFIVRAMVFHPEMEIAFRDSIPPLDIILKHAGNIYFKEPFTPVFIPINIEDLGIEYYPNKIWNYKRGFEIFTAIAKGKIKGNEETIKNFIRIFRLMTLTLPYKVEDVLDAIARHTGKYIEEKLNIEFTKTFKGQLYSFGKFPEDKVKGYGKVKNKEEWINPVLYPEEIDIIYKKAIIDPLILKKEAIKLFDYVIREINSNNEEDFYFLWIEGLLLKSKEILEDMLRIINPTVKNITDFENLYDYPFKAHIAIAVEIDATLTRSQKEAKEEISRIVDTLIEIFSTLTKEQIKVSDYPINAIKIDDEMIPNIQDLLFYEKPKLPHIVKQILIDNGLIVPKVKKKSIQGG